MPLLEVENESHQQHFIKRMDEAEAIREAEHKNCIVAYY